ncbi:MAG: lipase family alpha/beta hydrolase [Myxococcaceae bacterium]
MRPVISSHFGIAALVRHAAPSAWWAEMSHAVLISAFAALLVLLLASATWLLLRRRSRKLGRRVAKRAPRVRYPVVLAHGIMGFDELKLGPAGAAYFRGVRPRLEAMGSKVYALRVPAVASVALRAERLAQAIRELDADKVNIVAHSMGGLDARYAITRLGLSKKVASLTTVGTPHRGTPLADIGTHLLGAGPVLMKALQQLGLDVTGFADLTTLRMAAFNADVPDVKSVCYASMLAQAAGGFSVANPLLWPTHKYLMEKAGPNDGLVPVASQQWGEVFGTVDADHWAQIGWMPGYDAAALYERVVEELRGRGF